jgi:hypothetical protein
MVVGSAKDRIKEFLLANVGQVVTAKQLQEVASPVSEWARRVRELRDEEGWQILSHNDSKNLKPGQYLLSELPLPKPDLLFKRTVSQKLRAEVLDRDGGTCQMCGQAAGDIDVETGRQVRLQLGHIVDKSFGGKDEAENLRALCSSCNQGAKNLTAEKPSQIWLISQVRRAGLADQRAVFLWLQRKFGDI